MDRSVLLLLMSALLLSAAVGLPLSLEESDESWLDLLTEDVRESEELLDFSHENSIHKRAAKHSSSSSEEHKDKVNSSGASSSEEHKTTTDHAAEESTTQAAARRRRQTITKFPVDYLYFCFGESSKIPGANQEYLEEYKKEMCSQVQAMDDLLVTIASAADPNSDEIEDPITTENAIHKRSANDPGSSSEEHKDKANSSGESSSEEHKTTTLAPARRRRSPSPPGTCDYIADLLEKGEKISVDALRMRNYPNLGMCLNLLHGMFLDNMQKSDMVKQIRLLGSRQEQAPARRRRSPSPPGTCDYIADLVEKGEQISISALRMRNYPSIDVCLTLLRELYLAKMQKSDIEKKLRLVDSRREEVAKASGELELDAQAAEKMEEPMARALDDSKENGSIEDYAQGCEVMEVSSKEANEATYAE